MADIKIIKDWVSAEYLKRVSTATHLQSLNNTKSTDNIQPKKQPASETILKKNIPRKEGIPYEKLSAYKQSVKNINPPREKVRPKKILLYNNRPSSCPYDTHKLTAVPSITCGYICTQCNTLFINYDYGLSIASKYQKIGVPVSNEKDKVNKNASANLTNTLSGTNDKQQRAVSGNEAKSSVLAAEVGVPLYVGKGIISCGRQGHHVESRTAMICTRMLNEYPINVNYCPECDIYFLDYNQYCNYKKKLTSMIGNFRFFRTSYHNWSKYNIFEPYQNFPEESIPHEAGYNVSKQDSLSPAQRRRILMLLMRFDIYSKPQIISFLNRRINLAGNNSNMFNAVQEWKSDLRWITSYNLQNQKKITISEIKKYKFT